MGSEPSTPASQSSKQCGLRTPVDDRHYSRDRSSSATPTSKTPGLQDPLNSKTPGSSRKSPAITPEAALMHYNPDLSRTAVKRIIHDAKSAGLTFNQKKHRSPSHLRRSERRQQERAAKEPGMCTPPIDKENVPDNYADPWDDGSNATSCKSVGKPEYSLKERMHTSTSLNFGKTSEKAKTMR